MAHSPRDTDGILNAFAAQRDTRELAEETAALRREAAQLLCRSRWYRDACLRELLVARYWYRVLPVPPRRDET